MALISSTSGSKLAANEPISVRIVDADVHPTPRNDEDLMEFLPEDFRRRGVPEQAFERQGGNVGNVYVTPDRTMRMDADPPDGQPAGSDPALLERQLFSEAEVDYAILIPLTGRPTPNPEHEAAVCAATNEWLAATWLSQYNHHRRYRGSIQIASTDTNLAIREVEKWAGDHRFVQAMINPYSTVPLGHPDRHALYEVVAEAGLPLALHVIRSNGLRLQSPVGFPSYYLEFHPAYSILYWTHLASLIFGGVFEKYPNFKLVLVEGGFSWIVPFMWRMDRHWERFRREVPAAKRPPSEYVYESVRLTTQPLEEPRAVADFQKLCDIGHADKLLLFATDYPHWDFDSPEWVKTRLPRVQRDAIMYRNALELYGLPAYRQA